MNDFPNQESGLDQAAVRLLQRLTDKLAANLPTLAVHEFEAFCRELESGDGLRLVTGFGHRTVDEGKMRPAPAVAAVSAPRLSVPLGRIAWVARPERLPVVAIDVPDLAPNELTEQLLALMSEHHRKPFARFVFFCETAAALPLLGRYGFAVVCRGKTPAIELMETEAPRFGIIELRRLSDAKVVWKSSIS